MVQMKQNWINNEELRMENGNKRKEESRETSLARKSVRTKATPKQCDSAQQESGEKQGRAGRAEKAILVRKEAAMTGNKFVMQKFVVDHVLLASCQMLAAW